MNLNSPLLELFLGVPAEAFAQFRENRPARFHKNDTQHILLQVAVELHRFPQEIIDGTDGFNAGEAPARHYNSEHSLTLRLVGMAIRDVQRFNDTVSQNDRVAKGLHRQGVIFDSRCAVEVGNGTECQHELVIGQIESLCQIPLYDVHRFPGKVDRLNFGDHHPGVPQHLPQGLDHVGDAHIAAGDLVEHRRKKNEILLSDQHDFHARHVGQVFLQPRGGVGPRKTTAQDQDASLRRYLLSHIMPPERHPRKPAGPSCLDYPSRRKAPLSARPPSDPRFAGHIRKPAYWLSLPDLLCAKPLPRSPHGQIWWRLPPWRLPTPVRRHPFRLLEDVGSPASRPIDQPPPVPALSTSSRGRLSYQG